MNVARATKPIAVFLVAIALLFALVSQAQAAAPAWTLHISNQPETFERLQEFGSFTVGYNVAVENTGDEATSGTYTLTDTPPSELTLTAVNAAPGWTCTTTEEAIAGAPVTCHSEVILPPSNPGELTPVPAVTILMTMSPSAPDTLTDEATISGGGAPSVSASDPTPVIDRPPFGLEDFSAHVLDAEGNDDTLAGAHPYEATASFGIPSYAVVSGQAHLATPVEDLKDVFTELPPGLIGNASAFPRCPLTGLAGVFPTCPLASQIGTVTLGFNGNPGSPVPLYDMVPEKGYPATFAFHVATGTLVLYARLRPRTGGYGITVVSPGATRLHLTHVSAVFWGIPSLHNGTGGPEVPLLSNPVDCQEANPTTTNIVDSWAHPATELPEPNFGLPDLRDPLWKTATFVSPPVTGCENPALTSQFKPSIDVKPLQQSPEAQADQPTGLNVDLSFPQSNDPTNLSTVFNPNLPQAPELKDATFTLPAGLSISPSSAAGLQACSDQPSEPAGDQVHYDNTEAVSCADASKIGTVTATSPLLAAHDPATDAVTGAEPIGGDVYLLKPHPGDLTPGGQGGTFRVLIQIESQKLGINVKLPGTVTASPATGQLTATFTENPQLPVSHLQVHFFEGPRASLATPTTCGTYTSTTDLVPWSTPGTPDATPSSAFQVTAGPGGSPCPATPQSRPFAPQLTAFTETPSAGQASPFVVKLSREDGNQELGALNLTMPPGFTAKLAGIPYCSEPAIAAASTRTGKEEEASPSCPTTSQVGTITTGAGPGSSPYYVNGKAYLAGPYRGAPLSLVFITPAVAGPFDLGSVVVRAAVFVDRTTAQVTVQTDPIPQIVDGVPLRIRSILARIDRPGFTINPTNCNSMSLTGQALGSDGASAALSNHFQVGGCAALKFQPKFTVSTTGQASRASGASLTAKVSYPYAANGAVNLTKVKVELPKQLPSRLTTLQKACTSAQFDANPAGCPAASVIGHASVDTPILPVSLNGPAYFVSHGGEAFPSLVVVLQGYGITVNLVGTTFISKAGITSTTFKTVPDVPFTTFALTLPQGKFSALGANLPAKAKYSFCGQKLVMPTELVAQNGAAIHQSTRITTTGCRAPLTRSQKLAAALKACKQRPKGKRAACVKAARRQFATAARKAAKGRGK